MTYTYTYVTLEVSEAAYREISSKLRKAGYADVIANNDGAIDMRGIALVLEESGEEKSNDNTTNR